jgi:aerobic carbon-monoxide dehydrogenase medium subunit
MKASRFEYFRPTRLEDAIGLLARHGSEAKAIAGGQSLVPMMAFRLATPYYLVDVGRIPGLDQISIGPDGVRLGPLVRWRDIERSAELQRVHPLLVEAIRHVAHYQIRNRGTVGGSLAHADPAAELPGIAVTCDASIAVAGPSGERIIAARDFFLGPLMTALKLDELIVEIRLPAWPPDRHWAFQEFARRRGDFALAGVAVFYDRGPRGTAENVHVGAIGVADTPLRLGDVEVKIEGKIITDVIIHEASKAASACVAPADDIHAPGDYRRALLGVLTERALACAAGLSVREEA